MKTRITLTKEELWYLKHILDHFSDFMAGDDRPDHGMGILKRYRDLSNEKKIVIYELAGRLWRHYRRIVENNI